MRKRTRWAAGLAVAGVLTAAGVWVWTAGGCDPPPGPPTAGPDRPVLRFTDDRPDRSGYSWVQYTADGARLVTFGSKLREWDAVTLRPLSEFAPQPPEGGKLIFGQYVLAPDGRTVVGFGGERDRWVEKGFKSVWIGIWDWGTPKPRLVCEDVVYDLSSPSDYAFSPDGRRFVVQGWDEVAVLDLPSGMVLGRYSRPKQDTGTLTVRFTGDGRSVYLFNELRRWSWWSDDEPRDCAVSRWDFHAGPVVGPSAGPKPVTTLPGVPGGHFAVSPDGRWLVVSRQAVDRFDFQLVGSSGNTMFRTRPTREVHVWELATGKKVGSFDAGAAVWRLWFGRDGTAWALTRDGQKGPYSVSQWEVPSGKRLLDSPARVPADGTPSWVPADGAFAVSPDGRTFAAADGISVRRWDLATGKPLDPEPVEAPGGWATFSADGLEVVQFQWGRGGLRRWDAATGRRLPDGPGVEVSALGRNIPDPTGLAVVDEFDPAAGRHTLTVWDIMTGKQVADLGPQPDRHPNGYIESVAVSPDRRWVVVWGAADAKSAYLRRWDLATKRLAWDVRVTGADGQRGLHVSADGKSVYLGEGARLGFDADTGRERFRRLTAGAVEVPEDWRTYGSWGWFSWVGDRPAVPVKGRGVAVFDPETGKPVRLLDIPGMAVFGASADGTRLAVACQGEGSPVRVFDTATWEQRWVGERSQESDVAAVRFSADGRRLLVTYWGGAVTAEVFALPE